MNFVREEPPPELKDYIKEFEETLPRPPPHEPVRLGAWDVLVMAPLFLVYLGLALCIAAVLILGLPYLLVTSAYSVGGIFAGIFVGWLYLSVFLAVID